MAACGDKTTALIIDPIALAAVVILTLIMVFGVKESFWFNVATVIISVIAILLCIFMGGWLGCLRVFALNCQPPAPCCLCMQGCSSAAELYSTPARRLLS